ncbi:MAG: twin-arginine translocase TatA/TatE family subunit [Zetaproteobacteria bacterium CG12_big_fil_rev_8_21_14_0_65_54_13]|nr:MAG: twin-arginine translocase TatA/TatE family subunit [Zetaproteobacteria bacterium CG12_big_fil_rev_8_21_14_0_65_54_13]PIX53798.1 MAG: twin-arginine translocase TatA/TatE family subunit [Zetaproteobacteria bacterium CG_4_10_14_3_um_filter_54_28]PJA30860.1 MAG: twin-arginine translocase TatA/TatE family subunit [Zetaproteobacteria bacterium CG_4_9_14_3_um_filter_54_145]
MFGLGTTELLLILLIVVLMFGAGKIPQLGAGLAKGIKNFRKTMSDDEPSAKDTTGADDGAVKKD